MNSRYQRHMLPIIVIVRLDRTIRYFLDSPIKSGNDFVGIPFVKGALEM